MLHLTKSLLISTLAFSLAACYNSSATQTSPTLPTDSPSVSSATSTSPQNPGATDLQSQTFLDPSGTDLVQVRSLDGLTVTGIDLIEKNAQTSWRWAIGPETRLTFKLAKAQPLLVVFSFNNPISDQDVVIEANGKTVDKILDIKQNGAIIQHSVEFQAVEGVNTVVFKYKNWNKRPVTFAPEDPRQMAVAFTQLAIEKK